MTAFPFRPPPARRLARWALMLTAACGIGWLAWRARAALTPFIIGAILAYLFLPLVNRFERRMPRWGAILSVYLIALMLVALFFGFVVPPLAEQVAQLIRALPDLPTIQRWVDLALAEYRTILENLPDAMQIEIENAIAGMISQGLNTLRTNFLTYLRDIGTFLLTSVLSVANTVAFLFGFLLIPFWLFYVLMDQRSGRDALDRALPSRLRTDFWAVVSIIDHDFSGYLRGQIILGLVIGAAAGIGLALLNFFGLEVPYVLVLALIAGVTELIPIIGPIIGSIPAIALGFADSPTTGLAVLILYVAIQQLENHFLVPRIVGESVGLHPAVLMMLLVVCTQVFGVVGAILSAPIGAASRDVYLYLYGRLSEPPNPPGLLPERLRRAGVPLPGDTLPMVAPLPPPPPAEEPVAAKKQG